MTTIKNALNLASTSTDAEVADLFDSNTPASAHTFFKAIRCLVNTVTKLDAGSKKLGIDPETDNLLIYKKSIPVNGKARTEWGFDLGQYYVTYKAAESGLSRIAKGDEIVFEGTWPELKDFLRPVKEEKVKAAAASVVETEAPAPAETEAPAEAPTEEIAQDEASATTETETEEIVPEV